MTIGISRRNGEWEEFELLSVLLSYLLPVVVFLFFCIIMLRFLAGVEMMD
jgi:hypothetical protein